MTTYDSQDIRSALEHFAGEGSVIHSPEGDAWTVECVEPESPGDHEKVARYGPLYRLSAYDRHDDTKCLRDYRVFTDLLYAHDPEMAAVALFVDAWLAQERKAAEDGPPDDVDAWSGGFAENH